MERDGYTINKSAVRSCVDIYLQLVQPRTNQRIYQVDIEPVFLAESQKFYSVEGQKLLAVSNASEYLRRVGIVALLS